ncbi:MAG: ubiquinol oxidase subunit II [Patescibacteria group bacterium]
MPLDPQGFIAGKELTLILNATLTMLIVIVPVLILTFFFAWQYRARNKKATYTPDWEHAKMDELIWWAIPFEIVLILGALTWGSTHELDPQKPIDATLPPLTIEVVALPWKWLFIYPEQRIATVNYIAFPVDRPVAFKVTADAPMNSFWIPALGGQIYAMTGMVTSLNLMANATGTFRGSSANYSGEGFAHMQFTAESLSVQDFDAWIGGIKTLSPDTLTRDAYAKLVEPSVDEPRFFADVEKNLFDIILEKFGMSGPEKEGRTGLSYPERTLFRGHE